MRDSYSYKDILFGLYKEYVLLQEQLNSLNKYILLDEKVFSDIKFSLTDQIDCDKVRMLCYLYDRKNILDKLLERLDVIYSVNFNASYVDLIDGCYQVLDYPFLVDKNKQYEFSYNVDYILNTEFAKNMKIIHNGVGYDNKPFLSVASRGMVTGLFDLGYMEFNISKDLYLYAYSSKSRLNKEMMDLMLNMKFSKKKFPEYYQYLIENNDTFGKDVEIIGEFGCSKNGMFELVEDSKKLVLVNKK